MLVLLSCLCYERKHMPMPITALFSPLATRSHFPCTLINPAIYCWKVPTHTVTTVTSVTLASTFIYLAINIAGNPLQQVQQVQHLAPQLASEANLPLLQHCKTHCNKCNKCNIWPLSPLQKPICHFCSIAKPTATNATNAAIRGFHQKNL